MAYTILKKQIMSGKYKEADINNKLIVFLTYDDITQAEFEELKALMIQYPSTGTL